MPPRSPVFLTFDAPQAPPLAGRLLFGTSRVQLGQADREGRRVAIAALSAAMTIAFDTIWFLGFDVFGTVVDWRSGVARAARPFLDRHGVALQVQPSGRPKGLMLGNMGSALAVGSRAFWVNYTRA